VSVWHGGADVTVVPSNAGEIVKQWTDVHALPRMPSARVMVDGYPRQVWVDTAGNEVIESYTITNMAHGTPLATGAAHDECGTPGAFLLEVGISSSYHIARFFGLVRAHSRHVAPTRSEIAVIARQPHVSTPAVALAQLQVLEAEVLEGEVVESQVLEGEVLEGEVMEGEVLDPTVDARPERTRIPPSPVDIGAVITKALRAAGLMKGR
jgi:hypothetical protein